MPILLTHPAQPQVSSPLGCPCQASVPRIVRPESGLVAVPRLRGRLKLSDVHTGSVASTTLAHLLLASHTCVARHVLSLQRTHKPAENVAHLLHIVLSLGAGCEQLGMLTPVGWVLCQAVNLSSEAESGSKENFSRSHLTGDKIKEGAVRLDRSPEKEAICLMNCQGVQHVYICQSSRAKVSHGLAAHLSPSLLLLGWDSTAYIAFVRHVAMSTGDVSRKIDG